MTGETFFAISRDTFTKAVALGINPACTLLILASGTGRDHSLTKWSAEAVSSRLGVRWSTARDAIKALTNAGLVATKHGTSRTRPTYQIKKGNDLIWLPETLITGAGSEVPPVVWLRQTQDHMALRLLVDLYGSQNLREDGGISTRVILQKFDRKQVGQQGAQTVWEFSCVNVYLFWGEVTLPHKRDVLTEEETQAGNSAGTDFFQRLELLHSKGMFEWVPYLFEGDDGEPIHPMTSTGLEIERKVYVAAVEAASRMLTAGQIAHVTGVIVPVAKHIKNVQMVGVARLTYRPHTKLTKAWWADHLATCEKITDQYAVMSVPASAATKRTDTHYL